MNKQARIALAGGLGLMANAGVVFLTALWRSSQAGPAFLATFLSRMGAGNPSSENVAAWVAYVVFIGLALAEIPLMTWALRAMVMGKTRSFRLVYVVSFAFVLFAAVYAVLFVLLTQRLGLGLTIAGTGVLRLFALMLGVVLKAR
jgi:hypothetical protein